MRKLDAFILDFWNLEGVRLWLVIADQSTTTTGNPNDRLGL